MIIGLGATALMEGLAALIGITSAYFGGKFDIDCAAVC